METGKGKSHRSKLTSLDIYSEQHLPWAKSFVTIGGFNPQKAEEQIEIGIGLRRPRSQPLQMQRKLLILLLK